tara:strand:- start:2098 stop:3093 length:996 start_codon:yes stop_codon:yes gene_type:complete
VEKFMSVLVTGAAGFIGFNLSLNLLNRGIEVIGIDNLNSYYDISLKNARLSILRKKNNFDFHKCNIADRDTLFGLFGGNDNITCLVHLAAQAGVRYSLVNPYTYVETNVMGQLTILELCKDLPKLQHLVYASSSSVYGGNDKLPFSEDDRVDRPVSLYAVTKKADELMAEAYCQLYDLKITGLRFFTVYGPWGRPDMSAYLFTKAIIEETPIKVFNDGKMSRDFTYVDDIIDGVVRVMDIYSPKEKQNPGHKLYNIGNNKPEKLLRYIQVLEESIGKPAILEFSPMQPGDVLETYADITSIQNDFDFSPRTPIEKGIPKFVDWYKNFYQIK